MGSYAGVRSFDMVRLPGSIDFLRKALLLFAVALGIPTARGEISSTVSFDDPSATYAAYYEPITASLQAGLRAWTKHLQGDALLRTVVRFDPRSEYLGQGASGRSFRNIYQGTSGARKLTLTGAAARILDLYPSGDVSADIDIYIQPDYLLNTLWFDPHPELRTDPVPVAKLDAVSVLMHELGHALGFNGFINAATGELPAAYLSSFDQWLRFDGNLLVFTGPNAVGVYGGPVPTTLGSPFHLGNQPPKPGVELLTDVMNGIVFKTGLRYDVSSVDLAMLKDAGLPVVSYATPSTGHPFFFSGEQSLGNAIYYLALPNGQIFGYYAYLSDPRFIYHFDLGYLYWFDGKDAAGSIYFYDFASDSFFYTSRAFSFPYLYDFKLNAFLYCFPDSNNPGRYTSNPRYFYNFSTGQVISR